MLCIELTGLQFFAYHGVYEQERVDGNDFAVDLSVWVNPPKDSPLTQLHQTVDYAKLFNLVRDEMARPRDLLETVALEILDRINAAFPEIYEARIRITKLRPPIPGFSGKVSVTCQKIF